MVKSGNKRPIKRHPTRSGMSMIGVQRGIVWNREEYPKLQQYFQDINSYKWFGDYDSAFNLTAKLNIFIRQQYNDHRPSLLHKTRVSANDAGIADNKITAPGVIGIVNILANQSIKYFVYMSIGTGVTPETIGQKKLTEEQNRLSILRDGSMAARGNIWNHVGNFGYGIETNKYWEFGIHDGPIDPSLMLSRSVLPSGLDHIQNDTFLTASHSAVFIPK